MNYPPTKRLRGLNQDIATGTAFDDPFGDDDSFTQDDLDEIDIVASQAFTTATSSGLGSKPVAKAVESSAGSVAQSRSLSRTTANYNREKKFAFSSSNSRGRPSTDQLGNQHQQFLSDREDAYSVLEAQHAELKRKLKEVEEEILLKNGEIRVLRDSLKGTQQEKEAQRQNQILLESQRQKEQSDREKELNRKVHSLQSELQFKEAEINEMKTKLLASDKNKTASPLHRQSPKVPNSLAHLHHGSGSGSPSPTGNGFITKEMFGASVPSKVTPVKKRREGGEKATSKGKSGDTQETPRPDPFLSHRPVHLQSRGGVLLGLLLQQPLSPSNLGLSHLLSMSPTDINTTPSGMSAGFLLHSDAAVSGGEGEAAMSPVQSLAITGLNMLSLSKPDAAASSRNKRSCPGAVLLLPLLDVHLSRLSQTVDSIRSTSNAGAANLVSADHAVQTDGQGRQEGTGLAGFSMEDIGLASLRLLFLLVAHSDEVVEAVLSKKNLIGGEDEKAECAAAGLGPYSQNALLQSLLRLCEGGQGNRSPQKKKLLLKAMKTLCVLIERTPRTYSERLLCVLQPMCVCLLADSRLQTVSQCVSILTSMCDHQTLARQLCSQHDPCVFLKLFQFIRTRTDDHATYTDWMQLDLQVIRLLSRLMTQGERSWNASQHSSCQCYTELVQTVVIVFHRQWLDLRAPPELTELTDPASSSPPWWCGAAASLLRECLMLLHWLLLHHSSFSESCRPLLHMYDQVIPAVRDTLRRIPELSESEELALEEICRSEGDDTDDMDTDNVS